MAAAGDVEGEVAPGFRVLALRTPTLPPATTTNTAIIGERGLLVVEPATPHAGEQRRLDGALESLTAAGAVVEAVVITHHHADHIGYARQLADHHGVPLMAHPKTADRVPFAVDRSWSGDETLTLRDGRRITGLLTPGHAPGHLCLVDETTRVAHAGDMVAGEGFVLIDPDDDGDMSAYLESLERLRAHALTALVPAHGPVIRDPDALLTHYRAHRLDREARVWAALCGDPSDLESVLRVAYADTPAVLHPLARKSLRAHLSKLVAEGRARQEGDTYVSVPDPGSVPVPDPD